MHLILLRHAEKDLRAGENPGLSPRGLRQADALASVLVDKEWPKPTVLLSSPKRRTQETVAPLARSLNVQVRVEAALDERHSTEAFTDFRERLRELILNFEDKPDECAVWCTHLDSLDEFRSLLDAEVNLTARAFLDWGPCDFVVLKLQDLWQFVDAGGTP